MGFNKDQVQGRTAVVQGKIKEAIGKAIGNKDLEAKGIIQRSIGSTQAAVGDAREEIKKGIKAS